MLYVLDACALITFLNNETGKEIVEDILKKAVDGSISLYMSIMNLIEVHYGYVREFGKEGAALILSRIEAVPITIVREVSDGVFDEATRLKAVYKKISLADAIGLATTKELGGAFVTSDHHELEPVSQSEPISFLWLPAKPKK